MNDGQSKYKPKTLSVMEEDRVVHLGELYARGTIQTKVYLEECGRIKGFDVAKGPKESTILHNPDPDFEIEGYNRGIVSPAEVARRKWEEKSKVKKSKKQKKSDELNKWKASNAKEPVHATYEFDGNILDNLDHVNANVRHFWLLTERMVELYSRKNKDYGDAFTKSLDRDGILVSKIRLNDKMERINNLYNGDIPSAVEDESIKDTLIDIANYAMMTIKWIEEQEE